MVQCKAVSEIIFDAPPHEVYKAVLDKDSGVVNWGIPYEEIKLKEGSPIGLNMVGVSTTHLPLGIKAKIIFKATKIVEDKLICYEFLEGGDFLGSKKCTFEPIDGKTRMKWEMILEPKRLLFGLIRRSYLEKSTLNGWQTQYMLLNKYLSNK